MEVSTWSILSSMGHLAQGESAQVQGLVSFFWVGFLICKSRSHSSSTFDESVSKIAQLLYDWFRVYCVSCNVLERIFIPWQASLWGKRKCLILCWSRCLSHPVPPALSKYWLNKWMNKWMCVSHRGYKDKWDVVPAPWGAHSLSNTGSKLNTGYASWVAHF